MKKKILSIFLAVLMLVLMLPTAAFATTLQGDTNKNGTIDVYMTITEGTDGFYLPNNQKVLFNTKLSVPYFDLALYGLSDYYYNPDCYSGSTQKPGTAITADGVVTTMHVFIYATEIYMCGMDASEAGKGGDHIFEFISWTQGAGSSFMKFWNGSTNMNYYLDYKFPLGKPGWGSTSDQQALFDGMKINAHLIKDPTVYGSSFSCFKTKAGALDMAEITEGESLSLVLQKTTSSYDSDDGMVTLPNENVYYILAKNYAGQIVSGEYWTKMGTTNDKGEITVPQNLAPGTYYISCIGEASKTSERGPAAFTLTVNKKSVELKAEYGDVNYDGKIDYLDATLIYAYYNGKRTLTADQLAVADVSGDGDVNYLDATLIYAYYNGKITSFPAEK